MSPSSLYIAGLDASSEIERQISLTINNLAHEFAHVLMSNDVALLLSGAKHVKIPRLDGSYWIIQFEDDTLRIESISFWYSNEYREPLEWLKWTAETKGERKIKNYLWMRIARRQEVLMICHKALDTLVSGLTSRFSEMRQHVDGLTKIYEYALAAGK